MTLTAKEITHAKAGMHADGNGLYLRVQESGAKGWIFRFQLNGKRREMGIGVLSDLPAPKAREEAAKLGALVRSGIDPIDKRKQDAEAAIAAAEAAMAHATTFGEAAAEYIKTHKAGWKNAKHAQQWENTLAAYASPEIGAKPVGLVTTEDVLRILKPLWTTKTETATRLRSRMELVLSYAKAMKWRQGENPAMWRGHLDALLPPPTKLKNVRHHPALPYAQIPDFMRELRKLTGSGAKALEFAILTAIQRRTAAYIPRRASCQAAGARRRPGLFDPLGGRTHRVFPNAKGTAPDQARGSGSPPLQGVLTQAHQTGGLK